MLLSVLYMGDTETRSLTLLDEAKFGVLENRLFKTIYGRIHDKDSGELRQRHNDELFELYDRL